MNYNTFIDIIAWIIGLYWIYYIPPVVFSVDTHPFLALCAMMFLVCRCIPYIIVLEEYD